MLLYGGCTALGKISRSIIIAFFILYYQFVFVWMLLACISVLSVFSFIMCALHMCARERYGDTHTNKHITHTQYYIFTFNIQSIFPLEVPPIFTLSTWKSEEHVHVTTFISNCTLACIEFYIINFCYLFCLIFFCFRYIFSVCLFRFSNAIPFSVLLFFFFHFQKYGQHLSVSIVFCISNKN